MWVQSALSKECFSSYQIFSLSLFMKIRFHNRDRRTQQLLKGYYPISPYRCRYCAYPSFLLPTYIDPSIYWSGISFRIAISFQTNYLSLDYNQVFVEEQWNWIHAEKECEFRCLPLDCSRPLRNNNSNIHVTEPPKPKIMDAEEFLARFSVAFAWDYPDDWCLNDVINSVFHIIDDQDSRYVRFCSLPLHYWEQIWILGLFASSTATWSSLSRSASTVFKIRMQVQGEEFLKMHRISLHELSIIQLPTGITKMRFSFEKLHHSTPITKWYFLENVTKWNRLLSTIK